MRITSVASLAVALVFSGGARAQEKAENPYKDATVGDYVTYKLTWSCLGKDNVWKDNVGSIKETVTAKTDKEVTLKTVTTPPHSRKGKGEEEATEKIDLTKPYDPVAAHMQG